MLRFPVRLDKVGLFAERRNRLVLLAQGYENEKCYGHRSKGTESRFQVTCKLATSAEEGPAGFAVMERMISRTPSSVHHLRACRRDARPESRGEELRL